MNASVLSVFFGVLLSAIGVDAPPGTAKNVETVANAGSETGTWVRPTECGSEGQSPCPALLRFAPRHEEPAGELEAACESGDAAACVAIAWQLLLGDEVEQDATRASDLFEATCEGEELGDACYGLGVCNLVGAGVSIDTHRAARLFERACEAGSFDGCAALGECAMRSVGMGRDIDRAGVLTRYACDNGSVMGCVDLAALLLGALDPESVVIAEDACARGAPGSCELLEVARMIGVGFEQDWETGFANLERMCLDGGYWACAGLAGMSFGGAVTSLEPGRGRRLMESGCELGEPRMCGLLAVFVYADGSEGDREYARELLEWSCGADAPDACGFAGSFIAEDDGDQLRAVEWYERGCDWGSPVSCNLLATWLFWEGAGEHRDEERAAVLFEMVCDFGLVRGCLAAEGMHQHGLGVPVDPHKAQRFAARACDLRDADACVRAARLYRAQGGDFTASLRNLVQRGCDLGSGEACGMYSALLETTGAGSAGATKLALRSCELDSGAGGAMAGWLRSGEGSRDAALDLHSRACELGVVMSCREAATIAEDPQVAERLGVRGCELDDGASCISAGLAREEQGAGARGAGSMFERACEVEDAFGCLLAGGVAAESDDWGAARVFYSAACALGQEDGCWGLATDVASASPEEFSAILVVLERACGGDARQCAVLGYFLNHHQSDHDPRVSAAYYEQACEAGSQPACGNLATRLRSGRGIVADPERAEQIDADACRGGASRSCDRMGSRAIDAGDVAVAAEFFEIGCRADSVQSCMELVPIADQVELRSLPVWINHACSLGDESACALRDDIAASDDWFTTDDGLPASTTVASQRAWGLHIGCRAEIVGTVDGTIGVMEHRNQFDESGRLWRVEVDTARGPYALVADIHEDDGYIRFANENDEDLWLDIDLNDGLAVNKRYFDGDETVLVRREDGLLVSSTRTLPDGRVGRVRYFYDTEGRPSWWIDDRDGDEAPDHYGRWLDVCDSSSDSEAVP